MATTTMISTRVKPLSFLRGLKVITLGIVIFSRLSRAVRVSCVELVDELLREPFDISGIFRPFRLKHRLYSYSVGPAWDNGTYPHFSPLPLSHITCQLLYTVP